MDLARLKENWEILGQLDPMWAILSDPSKRGRKWDPVSFFQSGETDIRRLLDEVAAAGFPLRRGTALDFGCGLGRLTQALCKHFDKCYGVDISTTMLAEATRYNRFGSACTYMLNDSPDLRCFDNEIFDFIYSYIVLQHVPPEVSRGYISEFIRILKPGGLIIFQVPSAVRAMPENPAVSSDLAKSAAPSKGAGTLSKVKDAYLRLKRIIGPEPAKPQLHDPPVNLEQLIAMYCIPRQEVVQLIEAAHGSLLKIAEDNSSGPEWESFRYWATKSPSGAAVL